MKKTIPIMFAIFFVSFFLITMVFAIPPNTSPINRVSLITRDVWVDDDYNSNTKGWQKTHFDKIQDGINAVSEKGNVHVRNGIYYEHIIIDKSISLIGEDRMNTIIDGGDGGDVVNIFEDMVKISGFTIKKSYNNLHDTGIRIISNYGLIQNNIVMGAQYGIAIYNNNHHNKITNNKIIHNLQNLGIGILLVEANNNLISNNEVLKNYQGVAFVNSENNNLINNVIKQNINTAVALDSSYNNEIKENNIFDNGAGGIFLGKSDNNRIYHNNMINNGQNAKDKGVNIWDDGYPSGGNYWDDYGGVDNNNDGIGDTPYLILGGDNKDNYPLMDPY